MGETVFTEKYCCSIKGQGPWLRRDGRNGVHGKYCCPTTGQGPWLRRDGRNKGRLLATTDRWASVLLPPTVLDNNSTIGLGTRLSLTMGMPSSAHWGRVGIAQVHIRHCAELHTHLASCRATHTVNSVQRYTLDILQAGRRIMTALGISWWDMLCHTSFRRPSMS